MTANTFASINWDPTHVNVATVLSWMLMDATAMTLMNASQEITTAQVYYSVRTVLVTLGVSVHLDTLRLGNLATMLMSVLRKLTNAAKDVRMSQEATHAGA